MHHPGTVLINIWICTQEVYASAIIDQVQFYGSIYGAVHVFGGRARIHNSRVLNGLGLGLIATAGASLELKNVTVDGTKALSIDYNAVWAATCGTALTEAACDAVAPPPSSGTLCQAAGMAATGGMAAPWFGAHVRMCPGAMPSWAVQSRKCRRLSAHLVNPKSIT